MLGGGLFLVAGQAIHVDVFEVVLIVLALPLAVVGAVGEDSSYRPGSDLFIRLVFDFLVNLTQLLIVLFLFIVNVVVVVDKCKFIVVVVVVAVMIVGGRRRGFGFAGSKLRG